MCFRVWRYSQDVGVRTILNQEQQVWPIVKVLSWQFKQNGQMHLRLQFIGLTGAGGNLVTICFETVLRFQPKLVARCFQLDWVAVAAEQVEISSRSLYTMFTKAPVCWCNSLLSVKKLLAFRKNGTAMSEIIHKEGGGFASEKPWLVSRQSTLSVHTYTSIFARLQPGLIKAKFYALIVQSVAIFTHWLYTLKPIKEIDQPGLKKTKR